MTHIFHIGEPVICLDDTFEGWVFDLYDKLPIKEKKYHVRTVGLGRCQISDPDCDSLVVCLLLEEIKNPDDPYYTGGKQELSFDASRFIPEKDYLTLTNEL